MVTNRKVDSGYVAQYYDRVAWKVPYLGDSFACRVDAKLGERGLDIDARSLAVYLFNAFKMMFADEGPPTLPDNVASLIKAGQVHYIRKSFTQLLRLVRRRFAAGWDMIMDDLVSMIEMDETLILGMNSMQDFHSHCYMNELRETKMLKPSRGVLEAMFSSQPILKHWKQVPELVCVVIDVPISALGVMTDPSVHRGASNTARGAFAIQCEIESRGGCFIFPTFRLCGER
ncbi:hypothetical protein BC829DRAFT_116224 [Chytridium lagenaria]|nr:hypothetical protein BC829DRAFT_116224 [Chytridium lagenaria]